MLRKLRTRLTLLYLGMAMLFVLLMGGGLYGLIKVYFQQSTDQALKYRLVQQLNLLKAPIPAELANIKYTIPLAPIFSLKPAATHTLTPAPTHESDESDDDEVDDDHIIANPQTTPAEPVVDESESSYEGELASIFVLAQDKTGSAVFIFNPAPPPMNFDIAAGNTAISTGMDLRTITLTNGTQVRLLSYHLPPGFSASVLQLGRPLSDQSRLINQFLLGWLILSAVSLLLLGLGSWLLAGRSLGPAQKAFDQQQAFVANASHELRTPLTLIRASTEIAERRVTRSSVKTLLKDVISDTDYMSKLVEDLLLLSRLDSQKLVFARQPVVVEGLFREILRKAGLITETQGIQIKTAANNQIVMADEQRLTQLLWILLDNALQHTPKGGEIAFEAKPEGDHVLITVSDTGTGIPKTHLSRVFDRFYKAGRESHSTERGAGLGLSIAKGLIDSMHGTIRIDSQPGRGTKVTLQLDKG